ncbi:DNA helicase II [Halalkalibacter wakoensis JCM 9140]|uniref:DNA helicase II n=1 Tax=Halalkalibacter wakoensis JCM 9140 TaxID=1236970 RepID=W4Q179_9BACI|nr:DNA helicase II [Halalkalibacter wakoensis JCM 9140]
MKITAAPSLTLPTIIKYAADIKGINMIGIIDCHVPEVLNELESMIGNGEAYQLTEGGVRFSGITLLLGTELEIYDENCNGPIHVLCYLPSIDSMRVFGEWLAHRMKNRHLSSQRIYEHAQAIQAKVRRLNGLFIPAHVFTPFKSLYGKGVKKSLTEVFNPDLIDGIELGLSSDTAMAEQLEELGRYPFLSNSDAHSLEKMAREYQIVQMKQPSFMEFKWALQEREGRKIVANYGLNPLLGKYHQTICAICSKKVDGESCTNCQINKVIKGVSERIKELASRKTKKIQRPPYIHQVPLEFLPKVGKQTLRKLRDHFGTDMNIIHSVPYEELQKVVSMQVVNGIRMARTGTLPIEAGGGGKYGKIDIKNY